MKEGENNDTISPVVQAFTMGFVNILKRIESERQLNSEELRIFNKAYETAYLDLRKLIVDSFGKRMESPLRYIRNSKDWKRESEKQALLIIGATMVRQDLSAVYAGQIIADLFFKNEIDESMDYFEIINSILETRNFIDSLHQEG